MAKTASATIEKLIPIWQRVLQVSSLGVEDNFFDLGGDSTLALELFNEISRAYGRELPPVMIYHASTVSALAEMLEKPSAPRVPALVQLKSGASDPPVFITHGLGGTVMDFFQVLKYIRTPRAIHGMQALGVDGVADPFDSIENMADYSLEAVRALQPHGPYLLIGYSLGGLVILEMAQRLAAGGERVALLAMLDSYPHIGRLPPRERARLAIQQIRYRVSRKRILNGNQSASALSPTMQRFRESARLALERYQPRFYDGTIRFVRAAIPTDFPTDPVAIWGPLASEFLMDTVPGDHLGIMTTHYEELANVLTRYLGEALPS